MQRRIIMMSVVLLVIGALVVLTIVALQNLKLSEQRVERIQTFTGNILDRMQDAVITVDPQNRITLFNRQAQTLFGVKDSDILGCKVENLNRSDKSGFAAIFSASAPHQETSITCADGIPRDVAVALSETHTPTGELESRTAVIRDLTDARRLQQEIQRKDKLTAMGELASGVAHEIRNPLNAITMIAQRLGHEFAPKRGLKEYKSLSSVLRKEADRVNSIIHQFLTFARPAKLHLHSFPAVDFVNHIATLFKPQADAKKVTFSSSTQFRGQMVIDREQMTQAALNLLQNALDATKPGGSISLMCSREEHGALLTVADTGSGIPLDKLDKIFDLYFTTKTRGTGMGLAITQQIVTQHGGRIAVSSKVGKGTTFQIRLPLT
jgi:PAS domain S-box-containing protein